MVRSGKRVATQGLAMLSTLVLLAYSRAVSAMPEQRGLSPPQPERGCSANPQCAELGLIGDCCPTKPGVFLSCCPKDNNGSEDHTKTKNEPMLACHATGSDVGYQGYTSREGMQMLEDENDPEDEGVWDEMFDEANDDMAAPSQSPSTPIPCSDPYSNPRGMYTSKKAPCVVTFHNEENLVTGVDWGNTNGGANEEPNPLGVNRKRYHKINDSSDDDHNYYHGTSSVCGSENSLGEAKEYVSAWPDECVGDFARCYDLQDSKMCHALTELLEGWRGRRRLAAAEHEEGGSFARSLFSHEDLDVLVPPGTTHISVDCTIDKQSLLDAFEEMDEIQHQRIRESLTADKEKTLFAVLSVLGAVLVVVYAISQMVVQPIVGAIATHRGDPPATGGENQLVSLTQRNGLLLESSESEGGLVHHEAAETGGNPYLPQDAPTEALTESVTEALTDSSSSLSPLPLHQHQQIPLDFDAVPIVPATIIEIEAIHAEVIEDGMTYFA